MCNHEWTGKSGVVQCKLCQAVALFDTEKDPFGEGEVVILRPPQEDWLRLNKKQRHAIIENNRYHILVDIKNMGRPATGRKWSLSKAVVYKFLARHEVLKKEPSPDSPIIEKTTGTNRTYKSSLPPLPPFDSNWSPEVQLKWLEVYGNVATNVTATFLSTNATSYISSSC